jgi:hypothetical protein
LDDSPESATPAARKPQRRWYGWQTLISDGLAIGTVAYAIASADDGEEGDSDAHLFIAGELTYFLGPPTIHWAHGHVGKGFGSLAIRLGSAVVAIIGAIQDMSVLGDGDSDPPNGLMVAGALGMIAAIPLDAAVIANEDVPAQEAEHAGSWIDTVSIAPVVDLQHRSVALSALGRF